MEYDKINNSLRSEDSESENLLLGNILKLMVYLYFMV